MARLLKPTDQEIKLGAFYHINVCDLLTPSEAFDSEQVAAPLPNVSDSPLSPGQRQQLQALLGEHKAVFRSRRVGAGLSSFIKHCIQTGEHSPIKRQA